MRKNIVIIGGFIVILLGLYMHYSPYKYDKLDQKIIVRINRFTGETYLLQKDGSWKTAEQIKAETTQSLKKQNEILKKQRQIEYEKSLIPEAFLNYSDNIPSNDIGQGARTKYRNLLQVQDLTPDSTTYAIYAKNNLTVTWSKWQTEKLSVSLNGAELVDYDPADEYFRYVVEFQEGKNIISVQAGEKTYSYPIVWSTAN